jgi:hypothetical protein
MVRFRKAETQYYSHPILVPEHRRQRHDADLCDLYRQDTPDPWLPFSDNHLHSQPDADPEASTRLEAHGQRNRPLPGDSEFREIGTLVQRLRAERGGAVKFRGAHAPRVRCAVATERAGHRSGMSSPSLPINCCSRKLPK